MSKELQQIYNEAFQDEIEKISYDGTYQGNSRGSNIGHGAITGAAAGAGVGIGAGTLGVLGLRSKYNRIATQRGITESFTQAGNRLNNGGFRRKIVGKIGKIGLMGAGLGAGIGTAIGAMRRAHKPAQQQQQIVRR